VNRAKPLTPLFLQGINQSKQTHLFTGGLLRKGKPAERQGRKTTGLLEEIAGLPNRVAVLLGKHPEGEEERKMRLRSNSSE
jgi:hypothetical protein